MALKHYVRVVNFYSSNEHSHISVYCCHLGTNRGKYDDGHFLPHTQGFQYVGTILPFTLAWGCDTSKVHCRSNLVLFLRMLIVKKCSII